MGHAQRGTVDDVGGQEGVRVDALGDSLPRAALVRLGTQRFRHPAVLDGMALSADEFGMKLV